MNPSTRLLIASALILTLLAPAVYAQDGNTVSSDDILKQLDKKPEPAGGASRSYRGIRINSTVDTSPQPAQASQAPAPTREVAKAAPAEAPSVTLYLYFKSGSAELADNASRKQMVAVGRALSSPALAGAKFEIGGHTDSLGSETVNQVLSEQRAAAIRELLIREYGVNANNISAKGYGESQPVASNDTESGRAKNRRVVIKRLD